jgi:hypothetical protein
MTFRPAAVEVPRDLRPAEDVWPFLYLRNPMIPELSRRGMAVMGLAALALLWACGWRTRGEHLSGHNIVMLLLGAGFMLLETKAVVHMALVFGSTWIVNTVVFAAILIMILIANLWVIKRRPARLAPYYLGLLGTLALNVLVPLDSFLGLPPLLRAAGTGALLLSPVLCSGVIFGVLIQGADRPEQAVAYNTAGAMLGGLAETASLLMGFQYLVAVAGLIYLAAWTAGNWTIMVPGQRSKEGSTC